MIDTPKCLPKGFKFGARMREVMLVLRLACGGFKVGIGLHLSC